MTLTAPHPSAPANSVPAGAAVAFTGSWPALAAWAAGLVLAALGAGGIVGPDGAVLGRWVAAAVFAVGLALLAWGAAVLLRTRMLLPRSTVTLAAGGVVLSAGLLALSPAHTSVYAVGTAITLLLVVAGFATRAMRHPAVSPRAVSVWGLILGAAVLSVVVTPALGATQDAVLIRGDGTVPAVTHSH